MSTMGSSRLWGKITVLIAVCGWCLSAQAKYDGGTGEPNDPYRIATAEDMQQIGANPSDWGKYFILVNDVNLAQYTGTQFNRIGTGPYENAFAGVFDGNDHKISNFTWTSQSMGFVGLFGYVWDSGRIENLRMENANVNTGTGANVGGMVGVNFGVINNCYCSGNITGGDAVGGLVGWNFGSISECYSTGSVTGFTDSGGLVGVNNGSIANCYSTGSVSGNDNVGGLVGWHWSGTITNCYSTGSVGVCDNNIGGLVGWGGKATDSFWDIETSGQLTSAGGTPKTTTEMKTKSTFIDAGWDFVGIWDICEWTNYPRFLYQMPQGDIVCPDGVNSFDFALLARYWRETDCAALDDCDGADIDLSGSVDFADVAAVAESWLTGL